MALADGKISPQEKIFLDKLALNLEISASEYEKILEDPLKFNLHPPHLQVDRLERLYDLVRIVKEDEQLGYTQERLLIRFASALGFNAKDVNTIIEKALKLADEKVSLDTFIFQMK